MSKRIGYSGGSRVRGAEVGVGVGVIGCMNFLDLLISTYRMTPRLSRTLLDDATRDQILCITEVVLNTLEGNVQLPRAVLHELSRRKRVLRKVSRLAQGSGRSSPSIIRVNASTRRQLKQVYVTHYKTLVEFLERCLPHVKKLLLSYDDSDNEI